MECEDVQAQLPDHLAGGLSAAAGEQVDEHLRTCAACAAEFEAGEDTWQRLAAIPAPRADSRAMRARFDAALEEYEHGAVLSKRRAPLRQYGLQFAAAAALVVIGVTIGRETAPPPPPDPQIGEMRTELREMRHMVTLSLLQQSSASDRLKGVTYTSQIEQPNRDIVAALLDRLRYDPNDNVRLATIDALKRFSGDAIVQRGAVDSFAQQTSPFVQIALIDFVVETNYREGAETLRRLSMDSMIDADVRARAAQGLRELESV
jgi:hypothetical protein